MTGYLGTSTPACMLGQGLSGLLPWGGRRRGLPPGDQAPARPDRTGAARLPALLEQRGKEGLLGHGGVHPGGAPVRHLRHRPGRARPRGPGHHRGVRRLLPGLLLHPQRPERAGPHRLPDAVEDDFRPTSWSWTKRSRWCCAAIPTAHEEIDLKNPKSNRGNAAPTRSKM